MEAFLGEANGGRSGAVLTHNELVFTFGGSYFCANFGENRSRNATARVPTDGHTDANRFHVHVRYMSSSVRLLSVVCLSVVCL